MNADFIVICTCTSYGRKIKRLSLHFAIGSQYFLLHIDPLVSKATVMRGREAVNSLNNI